MAARSEEDRSDRRVLGRGWHVPAADRHAPINDALHECGRLAAALEPFFFSAVNGNADLIARWKNANRVGPARPRKDDAAAPATVPAPDTPATDKIA